MRLLTIIGLSTAFTALGQTTPAKPRPAAAKPAGEPKFKAIWEPVNVKEDLELTSVHFTSADEGWVAGGKNAVAGGVILHTKDGGANWTVQLGDPESSDGGFRDLRVLGPKLAFAVQRSSGDHKLMRTTDGESWLQVGGVKEHRTDYQFTSADVGFQSYGESILRTLDAGRKWAPVFQCRIKTEVGGLTREVPCQIQKLQFVNANLGFGVSRQLGDGAGLALARTEDGGTTWKVWEVLPGETAYEGAIHFFDGNTGVFRSKENRMFLTTDGGQTWNGVSGQTQGRPDIEFADSSVGWMMYYKAMTYTTNGGRQWLSRTINFPAMVNAFCLVKRDRGYAVGAHGMVYRYRIVPSDYMVKGMLDAPAMPVAAP
jgi:photosystem II stability/assembly factor-like uncharacterized protein